MLFKDSGNILIDLEVLSEKHAPASLSPRAGQIKEIKECLYPGMQGQKPVNIWMHGSPGTGKTTAATHILSYLEKRSSIGRIYVNCWKYNTFYSVLEFMVNKLKRGFGDARDTTFRLSQFENLVKDRPFIVVLDEIDLVNARERDDMIYNLLTITDLGLICISESRYPVLAMDERTRSRLNPRMISFEDYSREELVQILKERAMLALYDGAWSMDVLEHVVDRAGGDARMAIQILRNSAISASLEGRRRIRPRHVEKGFTDTFSLRKKYDLKFLTEHHAVLYDIIKAKPSITSIKLFREYLNVCEERNWKAVASRTFSLYLNKMTEIKLIRAERARTRGKVHSFRVVE